MAWAPPPPRPAASGPWEVAATVDIPNAITPPRTTLLRPNRLMTLSSRMTPRAWPPRTTRASVSPLRWRCHEPRPARPGVRHHVVALPQLPDDPKSRYDRRRFKQESF